MVKSYLYSSGINKLLTNFSTQDYKENVWHKGMFDKVGGKEREREREREAGGIVCACVRERKKKSEWAGKSKKRVCVKEIDRKSECVNVFMGEIERVSELM